jgi:cytochrome d ubiquinol oxidase subunit II
MLEVIAAVLVLAGLVVYVLLDGFDLGIGTAFAFANSKERKNVLMSSLAPIWDGNETWLVYAGGMAWAAFPFVYSIALPALYVPLTLMLFMLAFRGVSFEFRLKANDSQKLIWDRVFCVSSFAVSMLQGIVLGALARGISVGDKVFNGGSMDWCHPFNFIVGFAVVVAHLLLGLGWAIYKTDGPTKDWAVSLCKKTAGLLFAIFLAAPFLALEYSSYIKELLARPVVLYFDIISALLALCLLIGLVLSHGGKSFYRKDFLPIITIFAIIALCLLNLVVTMWPFVVYPRYTLWDFANQNKESLKFVVVLMSVMFPVIISYTCFVYYSFRGKVKNDENFYS